MQNTDVNALVQMFIHLFFIAISWWSIQAIQLEKWIRKNKVTQLQVLYILLSIALGSIVSNFFIEYLQLGSNLTELFT